MKHLVLLIDDNERDLKEMSLLLESAGYKVDTGRSGFEAIRKVKSNRYRYTLVILDYRMSQLDGADTASELISLDPHLFILIYSGDKTREAVKKSLKAGVIDFIDKGESNEKILGNIANWCAKYDKTRALAREDEDLDDNEKLISSIGMAGRSHALAEIARTVLQYRENKTRVIIVGPPGTGKECIANALHNGPGLFIARNCAKWINSDFMVSELFGNTKGGYTGAAEKRLGAFRFAKDGSLFLDELHTLSEQNQQILLRALQNKTVVPLGDDREYPFNCRVVAAAQPEIFQHLKTGAFRQDLWDRLNVKQIVVPPLSQRPRDIGPIIQFFCKQLCQENNRKKAFLKSTIRQMEKYPWPGNAREIGNVVETLIVETPQDRYGITVDDLDAKFFADEKKDSSQKRLDDVIRDHISGVRETTRSQVEAARMLGIPRSSYRNFLKKFGFTSTNKKASQ